MRPRRLRLFSLLALTIALAILVPEELFARRGGRISFGGSSGFSRSSSRASSWGRSSSSSRPRLGGSRSRQTATRMSTTDRGVLNKARSQGTMYSSRASASKAFQAKYGSQYTSKYGTRPATRPDHIPATTTVNGQKMNVNYNPTYGGYGYMSGGRWMAYSLMGDAAMMGMMMNRHSYVYGSMGYGPRPYRGFSFMSGAMIILIFVIGGLALRRGGH